MQLLVARRNAMGTQFEMFLYGKNLNVLKAAAEEVFDEIERLDAQLSIYRPSSEISQINSKAAFGPVKVEPALFRLLHYCKQLSHESCGTFDISIASLRDCWEFMLGMGTKPNPTALAQARESSGMHLVDLNKADYTVRFLHTGVKLDLGAIGKGYAIERCMQLLHENGIHNGLIHGGTSTVYALGPPPEAKSWKIAIGNRGNHRANSIYFQRSGNTLAPQADPFAFIDLVDESLSISSIWGKFFALNNEILGHIIDPKKGRPVSGVDIAAVALPSAIDSDALSTALLVSGPTRWQSITSLRSGIRALISGVNGRGEHFCYHTNGLRFRQGDS